jgi:hypothetical protein
MKIMKAILIFCISVISIYINPINAKEYMIYSIVHELDMGHEDSSPKKNFYVNMGDQQGVREGTIIDVYRNISRADPYETKKRYDYKVKIGEIKITHSEEQSAIGIMSMIRNGAQDPLFEIDGIMIGDKVAIHVK